MVFVIVFIVEVGIKIIVDGFMWILNVYFCSIWGVIDVIVLVILWINVIMLFI